MSPVGLPAGLEVEFPPFLLFSNVLVLSALSMYGTEPQSLSVKGSKPQLQRAHMHKTEFVPHSSSPLCVRQVQPDCKHTL